MRKPLQAFLLTLLTIGGAIVVGYVVAFVIGGQTQPNAVLAAIAQEAAKNLPSAAARAESFAPSAPRFEMLGVAPEPVATARAASGPSDAAGATSEDPAPPSVGPSTEGTASAAPAPTASQSTEALPSPRPFPTVSSLPNASSSTGNRSAGSAATSTGTFVNETFDSSLSGWPVRPLAGWSGGYDNGRYLVRVEGEQPVGIAYPVTGSNFRIAIDVAVESGAGGLVFMFQKPASFLWVGVDATGSAGVERVDGETMTNVVPWQPIEKPASNGDVVRLQVERHGNFLTIAAGARQLAALKMPDGTWEGRYGFVVAPRDGTGAAAFDNMLGDRLP